MSEAKIAAKKPFIQTLESGTYYWCSCGLSKNQPFCDGSHQGSEFTPIAFEIKETREVGLCQCKRTATPPFCDGKHKNL